MQYYDPLRGNNNCIIPMQCFIKATITNDKITLIHKVYDRPYQTDVLNPAYLITNIFFNSFTKEKNNTCGPFKACGPGKYFFPHR